MARMRSASATTRDRCSWASRVGSPPPVTHIRKAVFIATPHAGLLAISGVVGANNTDSQLFYSYSTDAGDTWSPNVAVSIPFNPFIGYPNQNKLGDYMTIVSDNTGGDVAYAATFNQKGVTAVACPSAPQRGVISAVIF